MDVVIAFRSFLESVAAGDYSAAVEHGGAVADWISRGGFLPAELSAAVAELDLSRWEAFPFGETGDDSDCLEFRFFVRPEGTLEMSTGPADYDSDHRGFCGAGSIGAGATPADIRAAVADCFADCVESLAQSL